MSAMEQSALKVQNILPHRPPMLMVDRILSLGDDCCAAVKYVSQAEPAFQGHFPDKPVFPGVLMIEAMAQTCTVVLMQKFPEQTPLFAGVENARFRRMVVPGDVLQLDGTLVLVKNGFYTFEASASVDGIAACTARLIIAMR